MQFIIGLRSLTRNNGVQLRVTPYI